MRGKPQLYVVAGELSERDAQKLEELYPGLAEMQRAHYSETVPLSGLLGLQHAERSAMHEIERKFPVFCLAELQVVEEYSDRCTTVASFHVQDGRVVSFRNKDFGKAH